MPTHIAIIQQGPVYSDLQKSLQRAAELARQARANGAQLVVFGETWLCGYPVWLDHLPKVALWDYEPAKQAFARMWENGVEVPSPTTAFLSELARSLEVVLGMGVNEVVRSGHGNGTIYNSFLLFDADGSLLIHHRKLMPTYTEKMLYGLGDGRGLKPANTAIGRIGGLICWEHFMPLSRQALHNEGELIHLALWPRVHEMHQVASRMYAFEGRCFVVAAGQLVRVSDLPEELPLPDNLKADPERLLLNGGSCVVNPNGYFALEPQFNEAPIVYHTIADETLAIREKMTLDTSGHYARPDVFEFEVKN